MEFSYNGTIVKVIDNDLTIPEQEAAECVMEDLVALVRIGVVEFDIERVH